MTSNKKLSDEEMNDLLRIAAGRAVVDEGGKVEQEPKKVKRSGGDFSGNSETLPELVSMDDLLRDAMEDKRENRYGIRRRRW